MTLRTHTMLFTDIVASTPLLLGLGHHEAGRLRTAHFGALGTIVEHHRGRVVKNLGDGIMAAFDAAADAAEAAAASQRATVRDGLDIRIGMSTGDVRVVDGDCFGPAVVEASRICALAGTGGILLSEATRLSARSLDGLERLDTLRLRGIREATTVWQLPWTAAPAPLRVVLADDAALVREGVARVLEERGMRVVGLAGDAAGLLDLIAEHRPDVAVVDVRMPPAFTSEGIEAAEAIVTTYPRTGVLLLSQDEQAPRATDLIAAQSTRVAYLHKERVARVDELIAAIESVATAHQGAPA
jgi:CheY-like chemotaxis protein